MMRLVRIARQESPVWEVLAVEGKAGATVLDALEAADPADYGAEVMLATLETDVPMNGPPKMNKTKCRPLSDDIFEFKEQGVRVLWFYDVGRPLVRKRIVCSHMCAKVKPRKLSAEIAVAERVRSDYIAAKSLRSLKIVDRRKRDA